MLIKILILSLLSSFAIAIESSQLQSGDVLLISFNCYECRVIESETNSNFSHSGVVIKNEKGELFIGQSLGMVALYSLNNFLKNLTPGTKASIYRPMELNNKLDKTLQKEMFEIFNLKYKGLFFDSKYLWNNFDDNGKELLYCSEFIAKYLDNFLSSDTIPYPLTYTKNYSYWIKYFNGKIPDGELGNSPASISRDERFKFIGLLD